VSACIGLLLITVLLGARQESRPSAAGDYSGKVIGITDGDTITVLRGSSQNKIRLHGIDCPETGQDFGSKAKTVTSGLVFGKLVTVRVRGMDRYGRTVAEIVLPDQRILNQELVRQGYAWWYRKYAPNDRLLSKLETDARAARVGLWAQPDPTPPWEWRRAAKPVLPPEMAGKVIGNKRSRVYHTPGCPNGALITAHNLIWFDSIVAARTAGFRPAMDCHTGR